MPVDEEQEIKNKVGGVFVGWTWCKQLLCISLSGCVAFTDKNQPSKTTCLVNILKKMPSGCKLYKCT